MSWKGYVDKVGIGGSFVAAACCLGLSALVSFLGAIGLGFLIRGAILLPVLIAFLALTLIGLWFGYRVHHKPWALLVAGISAIALVVFTFAYALAPVAYAGVGGLVAASVLNVMLRHRCAPGCEV